MYVIRNTFIAKPGVAGKLAKQLKEATAAFQMSGVRVMTDVTGHFNTVVMEHTAETLDELEKRLHDVMTSDAYKQKMAGYTDLWTTGTREIMRVV
jgi:hypothetical protein